MASTKMKLSQEPTQSTKYHSKKVTIDGITFDSEKEAKRWMYLCEQERAGRISKLKRQVKFELIPSQTLPFPRLTESGRRIQYTEPKMSYKADFVYVDSHGHKVVEDVKGYKTKEYKMKRKIMLWRYGIQIKEV